MITITTVTSVNSAIGFNRTLNLPVVGHCFRLRILALPQCVAYRQRLRQIFLSAESTPHAAA